MTTHQTHVGGPKGQTNSAHKLTRLKLPDDLSGKHVLDIGCNEGFFCNQAAERNAERVLGIDVNERFLNEATQRYARPNVSFEKVSWHQLPEDKFDLILWTSAMHYELDPAKILKEISRRLTADGMLILECGVLQHVGKEMRYVVRHDGALRYPTVEFIQHAIKDAGLSSRLVSHAEQVGSDPVPRVVYHCSPQVPTVMLMTGPSRDGKSTLAELLYDSCTKVISLDMFVSRIGASDWAHTPLEKFIKSNIVPNDLRRLYDAIDENGLTGDYINILAGGVASTDAVVIIEGYMTDKQTRSLAGRLSSRARVWDVRRMHS